MSLLVAFCTAETQNANIVLDNFGNIYKCWDHVYEEHYICNNLDNILNGRLDNFRSLDYIENVSWMWLIMANIWNASI